MLQLQAGDSVAFPTGGTHWISDSPENLDLDATNVIKVNDDEGLMLLKTGAISISATDSGAWGNTSQQEAATAGDSPEDDQVTILLSGTLTYDSSINHPFLESLPCFIQTRPTTEGERQRHEALTNLMIEESSTLYPGQRLIVDHLAEVFFVQLLREHMRNAKHSNDYMTALSDPHIGVALNLIHKETDPKWTVESLAEASAMGRTAFTQKFVNMVGETPKSYLTNTRLMKAKAKLQNTNESMISIAQGAGYASEAAFGKAIKKHFNTTPGKLRKQS
ncbi:AraC family transcriptional regulator [Maricurvus nonylphenolicus]